MDFMTIFGIAVALAMDAFAVSIGAGTSGQVEDLRSKARLAFHFGWFQAMMTILGWLLGSTVERFRRLHRHPLFHPTQHRAFEHRRGPGAGTGAVRSGKSNLGVGSHQLARLDAVPRASLHLFVAGIFGERAGARHSNRISREWDHLSSGRGWFCRE